MTVKRITYDILTKCPMPLLHRVFDVREPPEVSTFIVRNLGFTLGQRRPAGNYSPPPSHIFKKGTPGWQLRPMIFFFNIDIRYYFILVSAVEHSGWTFI